MHTEIIMNVYIVLALFVAACESYKILALLPYPGKSHFMVFEPILDELARRGHHVTAVSFFPSATPHPNRRDVSLVGLAPVSVEVVDLKNLSSVLFLNQFFVASKISSDNLQLCEKLLYSTIFKEFVDAEGDYDVILVEHFNTDCMLGIVHNYGLPSVGLMSCSMLPWAPATFGMDDNPAALPSMMQPFTDEMTFLEKLENAFEIHFYKLWHAYIARREQAILENRLGRTLPPLNEIAANTSVVLINTHYILNGVRLLPPTVIEVGGVHLHNKTVRLLPKDLEQWVSQSEHGIILFSFGSLIRGSTLPPKLLEAILKVFARLPQRILWKWETEDIKGLPDNVRVMKWLPQYDLLHHSKCVAFITHGGLLSLTETVAAGVPSLVIPVLGDQFGNAAYAQHLGISKMLLLNDIKEESFYEALMEVLLPEMRSRAKSFRDVWLHRPLSPMETAIYHIERTARFKGLSITLQRRSINNLQWHFFSLIVPLTVLSIVVFFGIVLNCCFCRKTKVKVKQS